LSGALVGRQTLASGSQDEKLATAVLASVRQALRSFERVSDRNMLDGGRLAKEIKFIADWIMFFRSLGGWPRYYDQLLRVARIVPADDPVSEASAAMIRADSTRNATEILARPETKAALILRGSIISLLPKFGFISHSAYPQNIFFHYGALGPGLAREDLVIGQLVEFELELRDDERFRAVNLAPRPS